MNVKSSFNHEKDDRFLAESDNLRRTVLTALLSYKELTGSRLSK